MQILMQLKWINVIDSSRIMFRKWLIVILFRSDCAKNYPTYDCKKMGEFSGLSCSIKSNHANWEHDISHFLVQIDVVRPVFPFFVAIKKWIWNGIMSFQLHRYIEHKFSKWIMNFNLNYDAVIKRCANTIETQSQSLYVSLFCTSIRGKWWYRIWKWFHLKAGRQNMCSMSNSGKPLNKSNLLLEFVQTTSLSPFWFMRSLSSFLSKQRHWQKYNHNSTEQCLLTSLTIILRDVNGESGDSILRFCIPFFPGNNKRTYHGFALSLI